MQPAHGRGFSIDYERHCPAREGASLFLCYKFVLKSMLILLPSAFVPSGSLTPSATKPIISRIPILLLIVILRAGLSIAGQNIILTYLELLGIILNMHRCLRYRGGIQ